MQRFGDQFWVAMNSDASVKKNKGQPLIANEIDRAYSLASLKYVSEVIIFNTQTLEKKLTHLNLMFMLNHLIMIW